MKSIKIIFTTLILMLTCCLTFGQDSTIRGNLTVLKTITSTNLNLGTAGTILFGGTNTFITTPSITAYSTVIWGGSGANVSQGAVTEVLRLAINGNNNTGCGQRLSLSQTLNGRTGYIQTMREAGGNSSVQIGGSDTGNYCNFASDGSLSIKSFVNATNGYISPPSTNVIIPPSNGYSLSTAMWDTNHIVLSGADLTAANATYNWNATTNAFTNATSPLTIALATNATALYYIAVSNTAYTYQTNLNTNAAVYIAPLLSTTTYKGLGMVGQWWKGTNTPTSGTNGTGLAPIGSFGGTNNSGLAVNYSPDGTNQSPQLTIANNGQLTINGSGTVNGVKLGTQYQWTGIVPTSSEYLGFSGTSFAIRANGTLYEDSSSACFSWTSAGNYLLKNTFVNGIIIPTNGTVYPLLGTNTFSNVGSSTNTPFIYGASTNDSGAAYANPTIRLKAYNAVTNLVDADLTAGNITANGIISGNGGGLTNLNNGNLTIPALTNNQVGNVQFTNSTLTVSNLNANGALTVNTINLGTAGAITTFASQIMSLAGNPVWVQYGTITANNFPKISGNGILIDSGINYINPKFAGIGTFTNGVILPQLTSIPTNSYGTNNLFVVGQTNQTEIHGYFDANTNLQQTTIVGSFSGNGGGLTNLNATNLVNGITVLPSGNVGIGTTGPGVALDVNGHIRSAIGAVTMEMYAGSSEGVFASSGNFNFQPTTGLSYIYKSGVNGEWRVYGSGGSTHYVTLSNNNTNSILNTGATGGKLYLQSQGTTGAVIDTTGNVGIGTTGPGYALDVNSPTRIAGASGIVGAIGSGTGGTYNLSLQNNAAATWLEILNNGGVGKGVFFGINGNDFYQYNWQGGAIRFFTGAVASSGTERMTILNNGNVGIGTTTPATALQVVGTVTATSVSTTSSNLLSPSSISFPATTVNWTNTFGKNIFVFIDNPAGVVATAIQKNGTTIFTLATDVTVPLQPGEYFSETYSAGSPTATWCPY